MGPGQARRLTLGVGINGSRDASLDNALDVCRVFGLSKAAGNDIITQMTTLFARNWRAVFAKHGVAGKDLAFLSHAFVNHL